MHVIADLHIHSKFSRAVSKSMTLPVIAQWARAKGIGLVATGDWTHPMWFREIERDLEETGNGLLRLRHTAGVSVQTKKQMFPRKDPLFLLSTEVSCIYSQGGKVRRIHTLIWVPSIESARKIGQEMTRRGCNLLSDGRPIFGLTSIQLAELVFGAESKALIIPAHCLLPDSMILGENFFSKRIDAVKVGERVLTHSGNLRKVTEVKKRSYKGIIFQIQPWYFRPGLVTTPEHLYYAIKTIKKCPSTGDICRPSKSHLAVCKRKACLEYRPEWNHAQDLVIGDVLVYPRSRIFCYQTILRLDETKPMNGSVKAGGTRGRTVLNKIPITPELGRLVGYYLAEGSTDGKNSFSFCFSEKEQHFIDEVIRLVKDVFHVDHYRSYRRTQSKGVEIVFYSKLHAQWLAQSCYIGGHAHNASVKVIPPALLQSRESIQAECLRGWYRGDQGYTTSRVLMNQMKAICLRLGVIPSILIDTAKQHATRGNHEYKGRVIQANHDLYHFSNFSFFEDSFDLKNEIPRSQTKLERKHGWVDEQCVYLPIRDITKRHYEGDVYNLEVETDHSYVAEFAAVHNCWTPWFSVYGSLGGFDSIAEAFGEYADRIYAVETGLSSNPLMNWRVPELDSRTILSFSDAHSSPKMGREATVFDLPEVSYEAISQAIITQHIAYTIEFYPEEGKYHYTGHRACKVRQTPEDTCKKGTTCPVCGKKLTVGVMHRVEELAGRSKEDVQIEQVNPVDPSIKMRMIASRAFPSRPPFVMLVPLAEIIAESFRTGVQSQKVQRMYQQVIHDVGPEFDVLLRAEYSVIAKSAGDVVAEGVERVRKGLLHIDPGYDGVFGIVKIWKDDKGGIVQGGKEQMSLL